MIEVERGGVTETYSVLAWLDEVVVCVDAGGTVHRIYYRAATIRVLR
jgi:hypothetical protein